MAPSPDRVAARARRDRAALIALDFVLPLPLTVLAFLLWRSAHGPLYASYVLGLALVWGYVGPGIGTNLLGLWRFRWPFLRVGSYYLHHGFMYAPYMATMLWLTFGAHYGASRPGPTGGAVAAIVVANALVQGFVSTRHDVVGVRAGMIEVSCDESDRGHSAEEIVNAWGPLGFSLIGGGYAAACLFAWDIIVARGRHDGVSLALAWAIGLGLMGGVSLPYPLRQRRRIRLPRDRRRRG
jgi:hypothetical protein